MSQRQLFRSFFMGTLQLESSPLCWGKLLFFHFTLLRLITDPKLVPSLSVAVTSCAPHRGILQVCYGLALDIVPHLAGNFMEPVNMSISGAKATMKETSKSIHPQKSNMEPNNWWFCRCFLLFKVLYFHAFSCEKFRGANTQTRSLRLFFPWEFPNLRPVWPILRPSTSASWSLKKWRLGWCINQESIKIMHSKWCLSHEHIEGIIFEYRRFVVFSADPGKCTRVRCPRNHFEVLKPLIGAMLANHG